MPATITVWVDKEADIIVQRIEGTLGADEYERLYKITDEAAQQLRDRTNVRVLADGRLVAGQGFRVRQKAAGMLREAPFTRLAIWGCSPMIRVTIRFLSVAIGRNIRAFRTEEEARQWLMEPQSGDRDGWPERS
jgi:hypothetical protein